MSDKHYRCYHCKTAGPITLSQFKEVHYPIAFGREDDDFYGNYKEYEADCSSCSNKISRRWSCPNMYRQNSISTLISKSPDICTK